MNYRCVNNATKQQQKEQTKNTKNPVHVKLSNMKLIGGASLRIQPFLLAPRRHAGTPGETSLVARSKKKGLYLQAIGGAGRDNHIPFLTWFAAVEACRLGQFRIKIHTWLRG